MPAGDVVGSEMRDTSESLAMGSGSAMILPGTKAAVVPCYSRSISAALRAWREAAVGA
ncbi:MAG: hypothetical protein GY944_10970 [bacterium]|nr:hypothetical protein [bacterium]